MAETKVCQEWLRARVDANHEVKYMRRRMASNQEEIKVDMKTHIGFVASRIHVNREEIRTRVSAIEY
jgi:hypothetical protein